MLLGLLQDDEYWADHGILVAYDGRGDDAGEGDPDQGDPDLGPGIDPELLELSALAVQPGGTVAQAGLGWLWGRVNDMDAYHIVRLRTRSQPARNGRVPLGAAQDATGVPRPRHHDRGRRGRRVRPRRHLAAAVLAGAR
jgi:hypothetical protein